MMDIKMIPPTGKIDAPTDRFVKVFVLDSYGLAEVVDSRQIGLPYLDWKPKHVFEESSFRIPLFPPDPETLRKVADVAEDNPDASMVVRDDGAIGMYVFGERKND